MKNNKVMVVAGLFAIYLIVCIVGFKSFDAFMYRGYATEKDAQPYMAYQNAQKDYTSDINKEVVTELFRNSGSRAQARREDRDNEIYISFISDYRESPDRFSLYITEKEDANRLIEKNNIKNPLQIDIFKTETKQLPINDPVYKNIFGENFPMEKKEAKVTGKNSEGYSEFDISPDAIFLSVLDGNIVGYGHVDNRLMDTRKFLNKKLKANDAYVLVKSEDKDSYNKYYLDIKREENKEDTKDYDF